MTNSMTAMAACAAALWGAATIGSAAAQPLDPTNTEDALTISRKIACSTEDGAPSTYWWHGAAYSRRQGERDKHLFDVEGMNVRACVSAPEGGFNLVSRELLLYKDKNTGEVLKTWDNPWTDETVDVLHVANDPVNGKYRPKTRTGEDYTWNGTIKGDVWWQTVTVPLYYDNVLGSEYQDEVGPYYHATEMFNFLGETASLLDREATTADAVKVGWVRMSDWLPWMKMAGREGVIYMHTAGRKLESWDDLPASMKQEIRTYYPEYDAPPPTDDDRANITSWKYYDQVKKGEVKAPKRK